MMLKTSAYFFAEYAIEFAIWSDLAKTIRELNDQIRLELIFARESRIVDLNLETFLRPFDAVHEVDHVSHEMGGRWRQGFNRRNVHRSLTRVFPKARKVFSQLNEIDIMQSSVAFAYQGVSLNQALFLKSIKSRPEVQSVLLLSADSTQDSFFSTDYLLNPSQSLLLNFYFHFFGTAYIDVFWARVGEGFRTNTREYIYRNKPADYVFQSVYPFRCKSLKSGQVSLPLSLRNRLIDSLQQEKVVFIGQPHYFLGGFSSEVELRFYDRLNTILDSIKDLHQGMRLLYKSHPGQTENQLSRMNLDGFEIISSGTSERLFQEDKNITTVYGFSSSSLQTALCYGIKSYYLYMLFYDVIEDLPLSVKRNWELRWDSEYHPEMVLRSMDDWKSGKNDYGLSDIFPNSKDQAMIFLAKFGIINLPSSAIKIKEPEERWTSNSRNSALHNFTFLILFIPKLILLFIITPAEDLLKNLRNSLTSN